MITNIIVKEDTSNKPRHDVGYPILQLLPVFLVLIIVIISITSNCYLGRIMFIITLILDFYYEYLGPYSNLLSRPSSEH